MGSVQFVIVESPNLNPVSSNPLSTIMGKNRHAKSSGTPLPSNKKSKLSEKHLHAMIYNNQDKDIGLESSELAKGDGLDWRTEQERAALLLWVLPATLGLVKILLM